MRRLLFSLICTVIVMPAVPAGPAVAATAAPFIQFVRNTSVDARGVALRLSWPAANATVSRYQLQRRVDGGWWRTVSLSAPKALQATVRAVPWTLHRFRLRAFDGAGRAGAWAATPWRWLAAAQENDPALDYAGPWSVSSAAGAYGGGRMTSAQAGGVATYTFRGTHVAWLARRGPDQGRATVSINGSPVATVDLYASTNQARRIVYVAHWAAADTRALSIEVEGTPGRPPVSVDAFLTLSAPTTATLAGAGDIGYCGGSGAADTGAIIEQLPGVAITLGDTAYPDGTAEQFATCYDPAWGSFRERTRPAPGNHDYRTAGAAAYFDYFGAAAGTAGQGWYTYQAGTWRVYALNSECAEVGGCGPGSAQYEWLASDLQAWPHRCVLAYWHRPRFSSLFHGSSTRMAAVTRLLYDHGAELVLVAHDHGYERFRPLDPDGRLDRARGLRHFTVGTGGAPLYPIEREAHAQTVVRDNTTHGVLRLDLRAGAFSWQFLPIMSSGFTDAGSASCHD